MRQPADNSTVTSRGWLDGSLGTGQPPGFGPARHKQAARKQAGLQLTQILQMVNHLCTRTDCSAGVVPVHPSGR